jgi:hypothetical protein
MALRGQPRARLELGEGNLVGLLVPSRDAAIEVEQHAELSFGQGGGEFVDIVR